MTHEWAYFLKVNVAIASFCIFYRLFLCKDTFFHSRRVTSLSSIFVAMLFPLFNIQEWVKEQEPMTAIANLYSAIVLPGLTVDASAGDMAAHWKLVLLSSAFYVYWSGVALFLLYFLVRISGIIRLALRSRVAFVQGTRVRILSKAQGPFSFFGWIFIHPDLHTENELEEILTHELTHVRQWHSMDVVLSELMCTFCWFNPFVWFLKRDTRDNLEFIADNRVLETGHDYRSYQYHLLEMAHRKPIAALSNSFNVLPLKNRIKMMNKKRTREIGRTKYLLFLPLVALLLIINNIETIARTTEKILVQALADEYTVVPAPIAPPVVTEVLPNEDVTFEVVEQMPEYPGGISELMKFLSKNIKYPVRAMEERAQGRVIVQFVVGKDGSTREFTVVRSVNPDLDKEAMRIVSQMPKWIPGKQRGQNVNVKYTVPVVFRLSEEPTAPTGEIS